MIYLDNAATTFPKPKSVYEALNDAQQNIAFNAGRGNYSKANQAHEIIEKTRKLLCNYGNAKFAIFTASATHAINQIIAGLDFEPGDIVYCSPYDHNAVVRTLNAFVKKNEIVLKLLPLDDNNEIDVNKMKFVFMQDKPKYVFSTHISNVNGYILPIKEMGNIIKKHGGIFIVDGAQAFGLIDVDITKYGVDYYVFAGHKTLYGPFGIAGFLANNLDLLSPSFYGGTGTESLNTEMPSIGLERYEPSSPNVVAIAGLYQAIKWVSSHDIFNHEKELYFYTINALESIEGITTYNFKKNSVGIISFNLDGYMSDDLAKILADDFNISVRSGYHCCPYIHDFFKTKQFLGTVRISFSFFTTKKDIDFLIEAIQELSDELF